MGPIPAFALVGFVLAACPAVAQSGVVRPASTPAAGPQSLSAIQSSYDQLERNVELEYAKLKQEAKNNIDALNDKIRQIEKEIERLKQEAERIELVSQKIQELLPRILEAVSGGPAAERGRAPLASVNDRVATRLGAELARAGLALSAAEINEIVTAVRRGGATAARNWTNDRLAATNKAIDSKKAGIKSLKAQIAALEKEIAKLEQDRQKALANVRKRTPAPKKTPDSGARG